jgi:hypothetical protein
MPHSGARDDPASRLEIRLASAAARDRTVIEETLSERPAPIPA